MPDHKGRQLARNLILVPDYKKILDTLTCRGCIAQHQLNRVATTFQSNVEAVISTASVPFQLALASIRYQRWAQLLRAQQLRLMKYEFDKMSADEKERNALTTASEKLADELESGNDVFVDRAVFTIEEALATEGGFEQGASELLRQSTVLTWSALEILAQETFIEALNANPKLLVRLCSDESAKRLFPLKSFPLDALIDNEFDLTHCMGDVLVRLRSIDSVPVMRTAFSALMPDAKPLRAALDDNALWLLNQRRNLIVHRGGVVDQEYLDRTGETLKIGQRLEVFSPDLTEQLQCVVGVGNQLLLSAAQLMTAQSGNCSAQHPHD